VKISEMVKEFKREGKRISTQDGDFKSKEKQNGDLTSTHKKTWRLYKHTQKQHGDFTSTHKNNMATLEAHIKTTWRLYKHTKTTWRLYKHT
jgi:hypothetical protein